MSTWIKAAELYKRSEYALAAKSYLKGIKKYPEHKASSCARLDYAYCLYKLYKYEEAITELEYLVEKEVQIREVYSLLARI